MTLRLLLVHQLHPGTWGPPKASSTVAPRMSLHPEKGSDEGRWRGPHAAPCKPAQPLPLPRRGRLGVCLVPRLSFSCEGNSNAHPLQGCAARGLPPNHGSHQTHRRRKPREAKPPARGHTAGPAAAQTLGTWGGVGVWCLGRGPGSHGNAMSSESVLGRGGAEAAWTWSPRRARLSPKGLICGRRVAGWGDLREARCQQAARSV